ncbi:MAG: protease complex subunit PrcB family protein [Lachnospiraceae bacterium]|nr:protease complex subunit PrcB family protein [Lachnospiraceae bacterium]
MSCYRNHLFWRLVAVMYLISICLAAVCLTGGCGLTATEEETDAVTDKIDFTVLRQSEIPEELAANIETRKEDPFKIAYTDQGYTYIAIGYGSQPTGGYSIMVEECYITETNLCVKTKFLGPETNRDLVQTITYPYIVIKVEDRGLEVTYLE